MYHQLPDPVDEDRAVRLALALAPSNPRRAQQVLNAAARVAGWTPTLRRANTLRCRWQRLGGEYRWRAQQQNGGAL
jgi:hypothetical protein